LEIPVCDVETVRPISESWWEIIS